MTDGDMHSRIHINAENMTAGHMNLLDRSESSLCRDSPSAPSHSAFLLRSSIDWHIKRLLVYVSHWLLKSMPTLTLRESVACQYLGIVE